MGLFLQPLPSVGAPMIINGRTGHSIASSVEVATSRSARRRGLLGRESLPAGCAFVLVPCRAVHTIGMKFAIDVLFIDEDGLVLKVVEQMSGWRMAMSPTAAVTIELWAGAVQAMDVHVGDRLALAPAFVQRVGRYAPSAITPDNTRPASLGVRPEAKRATRSEPGVPVSVPVALVAPVAPGAIDGREHEDQPAGTLVA